MDYTAIPDVVVYELLPAPVIRPQVTMRQAQLALLYMGHLDAVDAIMATQDRSARIAWATAAYVDYDDPLVINLSRALSLDLDELFALAATL